MITGGGSFVPMTIAKVVMFFLVKIVRKISAVICVRNMSVNQVMRSVHVVFVAKPYVRIRIGVEIYECVTYTYIVVMMSTSVASVRPSQKYLTRSL